MSVVSCQMSDFELTLLVSRLLSGLVWLWWRLLVSCQLIDDPLVDKIWLEECLRIASLIFIQPFLRRIWIHFHESSGRWLFPIAFWVEILCTPAVLVIVLYHFLKSCEILMAGNFLWRGFRLLWLNLPRFLQTLSCSKASCVLSSLALIVKWLSETSWSLRWLGSSSHWSLMSHIFSINRRIFTSLMVLLVPRTVFRTNSLSRLFISDLI